MEQRSVAIYWDFENLHAGVLESQGGDYRGSNRQYEVVDLNAIVDFAISLGNPRINRAYADWLPLSCYRHQLLQHSIDLVQLFPRAGTKNGADIRLALDALEDATTYRYLTDFVIVGSDSDYVPLVQKLRELGKHVIGVGVRGRTSRYLEQSCDLFRYYENLIQPEPTPQPTPKVENAKQPDRTSARTADRPGAVATAPQVALTADLTADQLWARELLVKAMELLSAEDAGRGAVNRGQLKNIMVRLEPAFDHKGLGHRTFADFLDACGDLLELTPEGRETEVALRPGARAAVSAAPAPNTASSEPETDPLSPELAYAVYAASAEGTEPVALAAISGILTEVEPGFAPSKYGKTGPGWMRALLDRMTLWIDSRRENEVDTVVATDQLREWVEAHPNPQIGHVRRVVALNRLRLRVQREVLEAAYQRALGTPLPNDQDFDERRVAFAASALERVGLTTRDEDDHVRATLELPQGVVVHYAAAVRASLSHELGADQAPADVLRALGW